jgi:hypothetical protein
VNVIEIVTNVDAAPTTAAKRYSASIRAMVVNIRSHYPINGLIQHRRLITEQFPNTKSTQNPTNTQQTDMSRSKDQGTPTRSVDEKPR